MEHRIITGTGEMTCHCIRLKRGEDLMESIKVLCADKKIKAGIVLSGVGCISRGRVRDASGVNIREITEHCEIVSLNGTVSAARCHIHIALSKEDLSTIGGHLCAGDVSDGGFGRVNWSLKCEAQVGILKGFNPLSGGLEAAPPTYPPYCKKCR